MKKILAIDDQPDNLTTIKAVIKSHLPGYQTITALSGADGIKLAMEEQPDVILLDLIMPGMDGFEVCRRLKAEVLTMHIPVVMVTAIKTDSESRIKGLELGADAFLSKPIDPPELIAQINVLLRIKESEDTLRNEKKNIEQIVLARTAELMQSEERYKNFISQVSEGVYLMELEEPIPVSMPVEEQIDFIYDHLFVAECNQAFLKMYDIDTSEEIIGKSQKQLHGGSNDPLNRAALRNFITSGYRSENIETREQDAKGRIRYFTNNAVGIIENGCFIRQWGTQMEITDRKQLMENLVIALEKAQESDRLKSSFLANMSHEIRTPMNAIAGFAGMISEPDLSDEDREKFSTIIQSRTDDLMHIINDILEISRIESGNATLLKQPVSLKEITDEMEVVFSERLRRNKKSKLSLIAEKGTRGHDLNLVTDGYILKQVFSNLIDNAIKYTESGAVRFGYQAPVNGTITCYVADTGIGISEENKALIFEHFRQAETPDQHKYGGTGLGLAICKGSLDLLGGEIWVESEPGKGSTFFFKIPYEQEDGRQAEVKHPQPRRADHIDWSGKKILLIEDEMTNMEFLTIILRHTRAELVSAYSGKEVRQLYTQLDSFDLVLLDIRLPDANGWDLAREIKKLRPNLPIIAQTAYAMSTDRQLSEDAGCDGYISKPIVKNKLLELLTEYFEPVDQ
jgi:signal transduction histidine kinase/DNA-binding response OmpR family regulator